MIKNGVGIDYFYIIPNPINHNYYQTMIKRLDKSIIDFSWVHCCKFKVRSITEDLTTAMREAIKKETMAYKKIKLNYNVIYVNLTMNFMGIIKSITISRLSET
jgi:hypothetical protein